MVKINSTKKKSVFLIRSSPGLPSIEFQINELREYGSRHGLLEIEIRDLARTADLWDCVSSRSLGGIQVDTVIAWRLDCLVSQMKTFLDFCKWLSFLSSMQVDFVSLKDDVSFGKNDYALITKLLSSWAVNRKRLKAENATVSRLKAKAKGSKLGRKKRRNDEAIRQLRREGHTIREIAMVTGVSTTAVQRALR